MRLSDFEQSTAIAWSGNPVNIYVAEIKDRGIVAFRAEDESDAERIVRDQSLRDDLMVLTCGGVPLWDGLAAIQVRRARPDEEARWRASRAKAVRNGDIEGEEEAWTAFLVPLADPGRS